MLAAGERDRAAHLQGRADRIGADLLLAKTEARGQIHLVEPVADGHVRGPPVDQPGPLIGQQHGHTGARQVVAELAGYRTGSPGKHPAAVEIGVIGRLDVIWPQPVAH